MQTQRTVLITGCSSGIGADLVPLLLALKWRVIATMRRAAERRQIFGQLAEQYGDQLVIEELDVTKSADLDRIVKRCEELTGGRLDALVNNAGYGLFGALEDLSVEQVRAQLEVNVLGLVLVTRALLPQLRGARGRVVNLSSVVGFQGLPLTSLYSGSKFAVEGFTESLFYELREVGVQVALVEPGAHRTRFSDNMIWGERSGHPDSPFTPLTTRFKRMLARSFEEEGRESTLVAQSIVRLLESRRMPLRTRCGLDSHGVWFLQRLTPEIIFRPVSTLIMKGMIALSSRKRSASPG